jgi:hypothetical protein
VKRGATRVMRWSTGALAAVPAVFTGFSWHVLAGVVVIVVVLVAALCWTITDPGRSRRLAMLITAYRGSSRPQASRPRRG